MTLVRVRRAGLHRAGRRDGRARLLMRLLAAILLRRGTDRRDLARLHRRTARRIPLLALCAALLRRPRLGRLVAVLLRRRAHRRNLARLYRRTARRIPLLPLRTVLLRRLRLGRLVSALLRLCRARGLGGLLRGGGFLLHCDRHRRFLLARNIRRSSPPVLLREFLKHDIQLVLRQSGHMFFGLARVFL